MAHRRLMIHNFPISRLRLAPLRSSRREPDTRRCPSRLGAFSSATTSTATLRESDTILAPQPPHRQRALDAERARPVHGLPGLLTQQDSASNLLESVPETIPEEKGTALTTLMGRYARGSRILGGAVVAGLLLAACGSGGGAAGETSPSEAAPSEAAPSAATPEASAEATGASGISMAFDWGTFVLNPATQAKLEKGEPLKFQMIAYANASPFWEPVRRGLEDANAEFGVDTVFLGPAEPDAEAQVEAIRTAINNGVDGLIVVAPDPLTLTPLIDQAVDAGIPVLTSNVDADKSRRFAFVGQDLAKSGEAAGEVFLKKFFEKNDPAGGPYKILTFGGDVAQSYVGLRMDGFRKVVEAGGNFEILDAVSATYAPADAYAVVDNTFRANPDAVGIYTVDSSLVGAGEFVKRKGLAEKMTTVGFDFAPGTEDLIRAGVVAASIGQYPYRQGYEPVKYLYEFLKSGKLPSCAPLCAVGASIATLENVDEFDFANS